MWYRHIGRESAVRRVRAITASVAAASCAALVSAAPPESDDFDRFNLDQQRWTIVDPIGDGVIRMVGANTGDAAVELSIPAGPSHDPWNTNRAFRVMQDAENYLRFEFFHNGKRTNIFAAALHNGSASIAINEKVNLTPPYFMRVERVGAVWTQSYSDDGVTWQVGGVFNNEPLAVSSIGLYAGNAQEGSAPDHTAVFDYFREISGASSNVAQSANVSQPAGAIACPADLTADGVVDARDLSIALLLLGGTDPAADLSGDGAVDGADVGLMLNRWGDCPQ